MPDATKPRVCGYNLHDGTYCQAILVIDEENERKIQAGEEVDVRCDTCEHWSLFREGERAGFFTAFRDTVYGWCWR